MLAKDARVLVVDDWIDTGEQMRGLIKLVRRQSAAVVGISCLAVYMTRGMKALSRNLELHAIMPYDDEDAVRAILRDNQEKDQSLLYQAYHRFE
ncbi:MAG: phosphoribosyltransferase [Chloroflexi bacterium]|nr:phosphoribosyltransferase [Chloroflexota bacterium]